MAMKGIVLTLLCLQASLALRLGNFPQSTLPVFYPVTLSCNTSVNIYARIFSRYDIITLPGITANTYSRINQAVNRLGSSYGWYVSSSMYMENQELFGPEQYGVVYRKGVVSLSKFIRHQPTGMWTMRVKVTLSGREFVLAIPHLPGETVQHFLELLPRAYETLTSTYNQANLLISGDFNTFPPLVTRAEHDALTVSTNSTFQWHISYDDYTFSVPTNGTAGAAARFLLAGDITTWVAPNSAKVFDTKTHFNMTQQEAAGLVLFYPVEMELNDPIKRST